MIFTARLGHTNPSPSESVFGRVSFVVDHVPAGLHADCTDGYRPNCLPNSKKDDLPVASASNGRVYRYRGTDDRGRRSQINANDRPSDLAGRPERRPIVALAGKGVEGEGV